VRAAIPPSSPSTQAASTAAAAATLVSERLRDAGTQLLQLMASHEQLTAAYFEARRLGAVETGASCAKAVSALKGIESQAVSDTELLAARTDFQALQKQRKLGVLQRSGTTVKGRPGLVPQREPVPRQRRLNTTSKPLLGNRSRDTRGTFNQSTGRGLRSVSNTRGTASGATTIGSGRADASTTTGGSSGIGGVGPDGSPLGMPLATITGLAAGPDGRVGALPMPLRGSPADALTAISKHAQAAVREVSLGAANAEAHAAALQALALAAQVAAAGQRAQLAAHRVGAAVGGVAQPASNSSKPMIAGNHKRLGNNLQPRAARIVRGISKPLLRPPALRPGPAASGRGQTRTLASARQKQQRQQKQRQQKQR
jgi:hypothetical protein